MLQTLIIDQGPSPGFLQKLNSFNSRLNLTGTFADFKKADARLNAAQLVFCNLNQLNFNSISTTLLQQNRSFQLVALGSERSDAFKAFKIKANDFLLKPLNEEELKLIITRVEKEFDSSKELKLSVKTGSDLVSIPTSEGYEFISASAIIRCEGLQKCTRIVIENQPDIISSYNLGAFAKMLIPFGFFLSHRSYLINICKIKKLHREGTITMTDLKSVPLARRQKSSFLEIFPKL